MRARVRDRRRWQGWPLPETGRPFVGVAQPFREIRDGLPEATWHRVAAGVRVLVVPGSYFVKMQAEAEGLDQVFLDAGCEWREPGCSMCLGMNPDILAPGERCASTSNRNFEGRQGRGGRVPLKSHRISTGSGWSREVAASGTRTRTSRGGFRAMDQSTASIGQRIRWWRKRRQLSQRTLAELAGRSESWLKKVEAGDRVAENVWVLLALANILKIGLDDLIGGVELPPNGGAPHDPPKGIHAIRRALFSAADRELRDLTALHMRAEAASRARISGRYEDAARVLPELIMDAQAAAAQETPGAWALLGRVCQICLDLLREVGERELALLVADRYVAAAQRSGDELLTAAAKRHLAFALLGVGLLDQAGMVCSDAADRIAPTPSTSVEGWSLWGSLALTSAIVAARTLDACAAWRLLRGAREAGERVGPGRNDYSQAFGPANVGVHEVAAALELGDPVEALRLADPIGVIGVDELPSSRRAALGLFAAQAHSLRRDDGAAVIALVEAEGHCPDRVRYSVKAHEIVRVCLKRERKTLTPGLRDLAVRLGVTV